jgi:hypothetical protein
MPRACMVEGGRGRAGAGVPELGAAEHDGAGRVAPARQQRLPLRAHRVAEPQQLPGQPAARGAFTHSVTRRLSLQGCYLGKCASVTVHFLALQTRALASPSIHCP